MTAPTYTRKDFQTDQEVRWCPGCGDYTILASVQNYMATMGVAKEKIVFISGIGCSSRFPYYMNTYGMHSIHGRAPAIASGLAASRPDLSVWVITGDGDALSIGGNHLIHALRRNLNIKILLFNNQIYGLTKGQYSPTSEEGKRTKSSPVGSIDHPFNPISLALGAEATFVARTLDMDRNHTTEIVQAAYEHEGSAFIEIYQNCNVFNDKAFIQLTGKEERVHNRINLTHGEPITFGEAGSRSILDSAGVARALMLIVAIPDALATRQAVDYALQANPRIDIVARAHSDREEAYLRRRGVRRVVVAEREIGHELMRHALHRFGVTEREIEAMHDRRD